MRQALSFRTKILFGAGSAAFGIKESGLSLFLLLYYGQVLGLGELAVGSALVIALLVDAVTDPLVGALSDRWRSPLGRRHPFMYASVVPVVASYLLLWNPPMELSGRWLWAYLLALVIVVRVAMTLHEIPGSALAAEMTRGYHQRTQLMSYRFFFGWGGGLIMNIFTFAVLLEADGKNGLLLPDGYRSYGIVAAVAMFCSILASALGTHFLIPRLDTPHTTASAFAVPPRERDGTWFRLSEMRRGLYMLRFTIAGTLGSQPLRPLLLATMLGMTAAGLGQGLEMHLSTFFWRLRPEEIALFPLAFLGSVVCAFLSTTPLSRKWGKRNVALGCVSAGSVVGSLPLFFALQGWFVMRASLLYVPLLLVATTFAVYCRIAAGILFASMICDLAEEREVHTGLRSEGTLMASTTLVRKITSGVGIFGAGAILAWVEFPLGSAPGKVAAPVLQELGAVALGADLILGLLSATTLIGYRLGEAHHLEHLRLLTERQLSAGGRIP